MYNSNSGKSTMMAVGEDGGLISTDKIFALNLNNGVPITSLNISSYLADLEERIATLEGA